MDFFYPNRTNMMWEIFGLVFFGDASRLVDAGGKTFRKDDIMQLLTEQGVSDDYEGQTVEALQALCSGCRMAEGFEIARRINGTPDQPDPVVLARAKEAVDYLRNRHGGGQKIAVVSHAAFLTYFIFRICGITQTMPAFDIDLNNTGLTRVKFYQPGTNPFGDTVFAYINNTAHLAAMNGGKAKV